MSESTQPDVSIGEKVRAVREQLERLAMELGLPKPPRLVAVSKFKPVEMIRAAYEAGQRHFGENYVQELIEKAPQLPQDIEWHFIGHLQSNKANVVDIPNLTFIETVDSLKLASKLNAAMQKRRLAAQASPAIATASPSIPLVGQQEHIGNSATPGAVAVGNTSPTKPLTVLVQVRTSDEDTKSGVEPGAACVELCRQIVAQCPALRFGGLMTIGAPHDASCFATLARCRAEVASALGVAPDSLELSMGMSADFAEAVCAGKLLAWPPLHPSREHERARWDYHFRVAVLKFAVEPAKLVKRLSL